MTTKKMRVNERLHMQPSDVVDEGIKLIISGSLLASINKKLEKTLWLHKYNWVTVNIKEFSSPGRPNYCGHTTPICINLSNIHEPRDPGSILLLIHTLFVFKGCYYHTNMLIIHIMMPCKGKY